MVMVLSSGPGSGAAEDSGARGSALMDLTGEAGTERNQVSLALSSQPCVARGSYPVLDPFI